MVQFENRLDAKDTKSGNNSLSRMPLTQTIICSTYVMDCMVIFSVLKREQADVFQSKWLRNLRNNILSNIEEIMQGLWKPDIFLKKFFLLHELKYSLILRITIFLYLNCLKGLLVFWLECLIMKYVDP